MPKLRCLVLLVLGGCVTESFISDKPEAFPGDDPVDTDVVAPDAEPVEPRPEDAEPVETEPVTPGPPVAACEAVPAYVADLDGSTTLMGSGSYDPGGTPLTYEWTLLAQPSPSVVALPAGGADRAVTPDRPGDYVAQLVVRNAAGVASAPCVTSFELASIRTLSLTPDPLDFGEVDVGAAQGASLVLRNLGNDDVDVLGITVTDAAFEPPTGSAVRLAPGDAAPVPVDFVPDAAGTFHAVLTVQSTAPDVSAVLLGRGEEDGAPPGDCVGVADAIYVIERDHNGLYTFDPVTQALDFVGSVDCDWLGSPASMAVGRDGHAFVRWSDQTVYDVDLASGSCSATPYASGSFGAFGMGFATDVAGGWQQQLYIANHAQLAVLDTQTWQRTPLGSLSSQAELTGNGDGELWAFPPLERRLQRRDLVTGAPLQTMHLPGFPSATSIDAFAFAAWGDAFWLFVRTYGVGNSSDLYRVTASGQLVLASTRLGIDIVGAGVSTCAP